MTADVVHLADAREEARTARLVDASFEERDANPDVAHLQDARDDAAARDDHDHAEHLADLVDAVRSAVPEPREPEA